jgi:hypothetical protein
VVTTRTFPFSPRSATALRVGDLVAVQGGSGRWSCLQVLELRLRARTAFVVGLLDWQGDASPTAETVAGVAPLVRALTRIEVFTEAGLTVVGSVPPRDAGQEAWFGPGYIGKRTLVWGWLATVRVAREYADTGRVPHGMDEDG